MVEIWLEITQHDFMRMARKTIAFRCSGLNPLKEATVLTSYPQLKPVPSEVWVVCVEIDSFEGGRLGPFTQALTQRRIKAFGDGEPHLGHTWDVNPPRTVVQTSGVRVQPSPRRIIKSSPSSLLSHTVTKLSWVLTGYDWCPRRCVQRRKETRGRLVRSFRTEKAPANREARAFVGSASGLGCALGAPDFITNRMWRFVQWRSALRNPTQPACLDDSSPPSPSCEILRPDWSVFRDKVGLTIWLEIYRHPCATGLRYDDVAAVNYDP